MEEIKSQELFLSKIKKDNLKSIKFQEKKVEKGFQNS
jgi:hypothetical protein